MNTTVHKHGLFLVAVVFALSVVSALSADSDRQAHITMNVSADPCGGVYEHDQKTCISPFIIPHAHIAVYEMDKNKIADINFPNSTQPIGKEGLADVSLNAGTYILLVENILNDQSTFFGPLVISEDVKEMEFVFQMHNSMWGEQETTSEKPREICFGYKITSLYSSPNTAPAIELIPTLYCNVVAPVLNGQIVELPNAARE